MMVRPVETFTAEHGSDPRGADVACSTIQVTGFVVVSGCQYAAQMAVAVAPVPATQDPRGVAISLTTHTIAITTTLHPAEAEELGLLLIQLAAEGRA